MIDDLHRGRHVPDPSHVVEILHFYIVGEPVGRTPGQSGLVGALRFFELTALPCGVGPAGGRPFSEVSMTSEKGLPLKQ